MAETGKAFEELVEVVRALREKCPWDSIQTFDSLIPCLENETREVLEGISLLNSSGNSDNLCEELGDVLMLLILESLIAQEEGLFTIEDVLSGITAKMKFRHPRIFSPQDKEAAGLSWEELKKREKALRAE